MTIILRQTKGAPLTHAELDGNFDDLDGRLAGKADASHTHPASEISDSTLAGRALLTAADVAAQQAALNVEDGAEANDVATVHGRTGAVVGDEGDYDGVGLSEDAVAVGQNVDATQFNRLQRYTGAGDTWTFNSAGTPGVVPIINKGSGTITLTSGTATIEGASSIPANKLASATYYGTGANVRIVVEA